MCIRDRIKVSLEHEAYALDITQFDSGESLLEAFEPEQFDICFLDIYMKEMNGMTVARELRALDPDLSIVFLTSSKDYVYEGLSLIHILKGSILDDCGNGCWQFTPLFRRFLARIIYKYLDQEKMKALYNKAMHYYEDKRNFNAAK